MALTLAKHYVLSQTGSLYNTTITMLPWAHLFLAAVNYDRK